MIKVYGDAVTKKMLNILILQILKDFSDDEKEELSDDFAEKYEGKVQDFINFISDSDIAVSGTY